MKKILLLILLAVSIKVSGQSIYQLQQDSIVLGKTNGTSDVNIPGGLYLKGLTAPGYLKLQGDGKVVRDNSIFPVKDSTFNINKNLYDVLNKVTARKNLGTLDSATNKLIINGKADTSSLSKKGYALHGAIFTDNQAINTREPSVAVVGNKIYVFVSYGTARKEQANNTKIGMAVVDTSATNYTLTYTDIGVSQPGLDNANTAVAYDPVSGIMGLFFKATTVGQPAPDNGQCYYTYATAPFTTWSTPVAINSGTVTSITAYDTPKKWNDGKWHTFLYRTNYAENWESTDLSSWSYVNTTYDWRVSGNPISGSSMIEPTVIVAPGDTLLMAIRPNGTYGALTHQAMLSSTASTPSFSYIGELTGGVNNVASETPYNSAVPVHGYYDSVTKKAIWVVTTRFQRFYPGIGKDSVYVIQGTPSAVVSNPASYTRLAGYERPYKTDDIFKGYITITPVRSGWYVLWGTESVRPVTTAADQNNDLVTTGIRYDLRYTNRGYGQKTTGAIYRDSKETYNSYTGLYDFITKQRDYMGDTTVRNYQGTHYFRPGFNASNSRPVFMVGSTQFNVAPRWYSTEILWRSNIATSVLSLASDGAISGTTIGGTVGTLSTSVNAPKIYSNITTPGVNMPSTGQLYLNNTGSAYATSYYPNAVFSRPNSTATHSSWIGSNSSNHAVWVSNNQPLVIGSELSGTVTPVLTINQDALGKGVTLASGTGPNTQGTLTNNAGVPQWYDGSTKQTLAYLASPTFTGTPAAPTASVGTNTTQVATTAFVQAATAALVDNILSKTADYTIVAGDFAAGKKTTLDLYVDATAGNVTITLPTYTSFAGYTIYVTKTDATANTVTMNTVVGSNTLATQYQVRQFNTAPSIGWVNH